MSFFASIKSLKIHNLLIHIVTICAKLNSQKEIEKMLICLELIGIMD